MMMAITHDEIRRHPRWRAELSTPTDGVRTPRSGRALVVIGVGVAIVLVAAVILLLQG